MGRFLVSARGLAPATVDAGNWLAALGLGLDQLGVVAELHRLACEVLPNGTVIARDVGAGAAFVVRPAPPDVVEPSPEATRPSKAGNRPRFSEPTEAAEGFETPDAPEETPEEEDTELDEEKEESDDIDEAALQRLRAASGASNDADESSVEEAFEVSDEISSEDGDEDDEYEDEDDVVEDEEVGFDGEADEAPSSEIPTTEGTFEALEALEAVDDSPHVALAFRELQRPIGYEPGTDAPEFADDFADDPNLMDFEPETENDEEELEEREMVELLEVIREAPSDLVAWQAALEVASMLVPSEAGSALRQEPDGGVRFVGTRGPEAHRLTAIKLPRGTGIVGFCLDRVVSLIVHDPKNDPRFFKAMDEVTNFTTRGVLCVPVAREGQTYGCIELVNPAAGTQFNRVHLELVELVAGALAQRLVTGRTPS